MADSKYKLTYFNVKGFAEYIRYMFAYNDVEFEDNRVAHADWPAIKDKQPYGQVPVLEVDGKKLCQSIAILRFLGKRFGMTPDDPFTEALLEAMVDSIRDLLSKMKEEMTLKTPEAAKESAEAVKFLLDKIEPELADGYFYSSKPTWVDIYIAGLFETMTGFKPEILDGHPKIKAHCEKIRSKDGIQKYIKQRPEPEIITAPHTHKDD